MFFLVYCYLEVEGQTSEMCYSQIFLWENFGIQLVQAYAEIGKKNNLCVQLLQSSYVSWAFEAKNVLCRNCCFLQVWKGKKPGVHFVKYV